LCHPAGGFTRQYQTPSNAVLWTGIATAVCMFLGDAILIPITEVGSVACAIGWSATCAACLALDWNRSSGIALSTIGRLVTITGLLVGLAMIAMKWVPAVPGHFSVYEWIAVCGLGGYGAFSVSRHEAWKIGFATIRERNRILVTRGRL